MRAIPIHVEFVSFPELFASSKDRRTYPMGLVNQLLITAMPDHQKSLEAVSYTHLTLPTIYSV